MIKSTIKLLLALAMTVTLGSSFLAQAQNTQSQWEAIFSRASETAVFENGKIVSLKQPIPNESEKTFSFTHSENGSSSTMTDENGLSLQILFYEDRRIESVIMPNGEKVEVTWIQSSSGKKFPENLKCNNTLLPAPDGTSNPCRDALVAIGVAAYICANAPGSAACWGATANAAYHTYRCWESTRLAFVPINKSFEYYTRQFDFRQKPLNKGKFAINSRLSKN